MLTVGHGGDIFGHNGIRVDFSVNTNPLGMPDVIRKRIWDSREMWEKYPDSLCRSLRGKMADAFLSPGTGLSEGCFLFGNGASDLLFSAVFALRPERAVLAVPGFSEYGQALLAAGCRAESVFLREDADFALEEREKELSERIRAVRPAMVIIGNPNNPTGDAVSGGWMERLADVCRECGTVLLVDECFNWFLENRKEYSLFPSLEREPERFRHVILLNAFTKIFSMAGLRFGFAVCGDPEIISRIEAVRQPWSVSAPAQAAAEAALSCLPFAEKTAGFVRTEREFLSQGLREAGFKVYPSLVNYILFRKKWDDPTDYREYCLKNGILIRAGGNFEGLDERFYRVSVRRRDENAELLACLKKAGQEEKFPLRTRKGGTQRDRRGCGEEQR